MLNSGDADGLRASKHSHAVEHTHANSHFSRLGTDTARPQAIARERLESVHQVLDQRALVIATALLPLRAATLRNGGNGIVSPASAGRARWPWRRSFARRDRRLGAARGDRRMTVLRVVRPVAADRIDWHVGGDLVEQIGQHAGVVDVLMGHQRTAYLTGLRVHRQMHLAPGAAFRIAVFAHFPFAFAVKLEPRAVDDQMQRLAAMQRGQDNLKLLRAAAQRGVVRHRQAGERELTQTLREALKRPQRQTEHLLETEQHLDHRVRVDARSATFARSGFRRVSQYAVVDPHSYIASGDQARVVFRPVPNAIDPLGFACLAFVLAHLPGQKSRIYAVPPRVNRGDDLTVACKRQPAARHLDLCNNARDGGIGFCVLRDISVRRKGENRQGSWHRPQRRSAGSH
jgi:hypothetical protein